MSTISFIFCPKVFLNTRNVQQLFLANTKLIAKRRKHPHFPLYGMARPSQMPVKYKTATDKCDFNITARIVSVESTIEIFAVAQVPQRHQQ